MVIEALTQCTATQHFALFDSPTEIIEKQLDPQIFVTGKPHIFSEVETRLTRQTRSVSLCSAKDDIKQFPPFRLSEDETPMLWI